MSPRSAPPGIPSQGAAGRFAGHIRRRIEPEFVDERGGIARLLDDGVTSIRSALLITSKAGAVRANHYHKEDAHYCYLLSGRMEYLERPAEQADAPLAREVLEAGDLVYTPPRAAHAMRFLEDSTFLALATKSRHQEAYEQDTVRVQLV